ncbi:type II toxin-antitoxin system VapB family antitoxin [Solimicrobium silvestre]|uniref:Uncharacterized protein conserved in bacteria (DUF2191) n=1 Tax=Solimicrobium silvestre TaxID=2099400 RepID=A0A2S9GX25_9BURK|nr:type II toxin-antitoxin system VapB family antitoxin [Solimicrobium silvestre]PRC92273.1 Uncharacterized protein conserved in bacteria (DUF2191) [Solimicrobium silvestre]
MRTTITLDDDLLARALEISGKTERTEVLHEALRALIAREAAKRLAQLAGSMPDAQDIPRRREEMP